MKAECIVCGRCCPVRRALRRGWQRGACTCGTCPTGALWLCPEHRVEVAT